MQTPCDDLWVWLEIHKHSSYRLASREQRHRQIGAGELGDRDGVDGAASAGGQAQGGDNDERFIGFISGHLLQVEIFEQVEAEVADGDAVDGQVIGRDRTHHLDAVVVGANCSDIMLLEPGQG